MIALKVCKLLTLTFILSLGLTSVSAKASEHDDGGHGGHGAILKTGRYSGLLEPSGSQIKIDAALDLFYTQVDAEFPQLSGILKLRFGGARSPEYVSYFYEKVLFDPNTNLLTLDSRDAEVSVRKLMIHGQMLMGEFRSRSTGQTGAINLYFKRSFDLPPVNGNPEPPEDCLPDEPCDDPEDGAPPPPDHGDHGSHSLMSRSPELQASQVSGTLSPLAGEFYGKCEGEQQVIQILTSRSTSTLEQRPSAFSDYHVFGSLSRIRKNEKMKISAFASANYDFFSGNLTLIGSPKDLECRLNGSTLTCGQCAFQRKTSTESLFSIGFDGFNFHERQHKVDRGQYPLLTGTPEPSDVDGDYFGYLHHELLDQYQAVKLNVSSYKHTDRMHGPAQLFLSGSLDLHFGSTESIERIRYPFDSRLWLSSEGAMMLQGTGSEAFGVVREWRRGLIIVDWYSRNFSRVGTIELVKGMAPTLPSSASLVSELKGKYVGPIIHFSLDVRSRGEVEPEPANPFFPLVLSGTTFIKNIAPELKIAEGSFDFYTGAFWFANASGNHLWGKRASGNELKLFVTGINQFASPLLPIKFEGYKRK